MGKKIAHILLVEDHPLLLESLRMVFMELEKENSQYLFTIRNAYSCESAVNLLKNDTSLAGFDLVVLDYGIHSSNEGKYFSGEEVGIFIRKRFIQTKILFISAEPHPMKIQDIFRNVDPEGFVHKEDSKGEILKEAVKDILDGKCYYSKGIQGAMRATISGDFLLDEWDRRILFELGRGTKTIDLPQLLPLSLSTVARRKRRLKEVFDIEGGDDAALVRKAKEWGYG